MEQEVSFALCTRGSAEMVVNGTVCAIASGSLILRTPLFFYMETSRSDDYEECAMSTALEDVQSLIAPYSSQMFAGNVHFVPCLNTDKEQMDYLRQKIDIDRRRVASLDALPQLQRSLAQAIILRERQTMFMEVIMLFLQNQPAVPVKRSRQEALFQDFIVALVNSYVEHRDVAWYADSASLSVRHFSFMIRRHSGRTPMEWITLVTLTHAKRLLSQPGVQVKEVADLLGFPEQFTFRKYFKQHTGVSPSEFQRRGERNLPSLISCGTIG